MSCPQSFSGSFSTAYPVLARQLGQQIQEALLDHEALSQPLPLCDLQACRASCCHDGVVLSEEEAAVIGEEATVLENGKLKTSIIPAASDLIADDYPAAFPRTRCVFLDKRHHCQLQIKGAWEGRHPWHYKPLSCWLHPLLVTRRKGRYVLTLLDSRKDPDHFATQTPCGRSLKGSAPAFRTLAAELRALSELSGRDLMRELAAPQLPPEHG